MKISAATDGALTFKSRVHFGRGGQGRVKLQPGPAHQVPSPPRGRIPRISRLMALAIHFDAMLRRGEVKDLAELARLGHVTRARATQILNLTMLAPDIQEALLFIPPVEAGRDTYKEWQVRPIAAEPVWGRQRRMWPRLSSAAGESKPQQ